MLVPCEQYYVMVRCADMFFGPRQATGTHMRFQTEAVVFLHFACEMIFSLGKNKEQRRQEAPQIKLTRWGSMDALGVRGNGTGLPSCYHSIDNEMCTGFSLG
jgi:hypothetical protein